MLLHFSNLQSSKCVSDFKHSISILLIIANMSFLSSCLHPFCKLTKVFYRRQTIRYSEEALGLSQGEAKFKCFFSPAYLSVGKNLFQVNNSDIQTMIVDTVLKPWLLTLNSHLPAILWLKLSCYINQSRSESIFNFFLEIDINLLCRLVSWVVCTPYPLLCQGFV